MDARGHVRLNGGMPTSSQPVLLFLHGHYGVRDDLAWMAERTPRPWRPLLLQGPVAVGERFAWFSVPETAEAGPRSSAVAPAADDLLAWIDENLGDAPVAAVGWSQGGATALQAMRRAPRRLGSVVTLGGFTTIDAERGDAELARLRPPVFWGHGARDEVIPEHDIARMRDFLPPHSSLVERVYPEAGHEISEEMADDAFRFLVDRTGSLLS